MKSRLTKHLHQVLCKLILVMFVFANVAPAFANSSLLPYASLPPGALYDPALIFETQAAINIYDSTRPLGQLPTGSVFETQMSRDPFHYVLNANTFDYNAMLATAYQMPTFNGLMIPATVVEPIMFGNGTTLPVNSVFYIPPVDFSFQKIHAIGARSDTYDEDIDLFYDRVLSDSRTYDLSGLDDDIDLAAEDHDTDTELSKKRRERTKKVAESIRPSSPDYYKVEATKVKPIAEAKRTDQKSQPKITPQTPPNEPFKVSGPTCDCRSRGRACVKSGNFGTNRKTHKHAGVDISGGHRTPIVAATDGVVTVKYRSKTYGNTLDIRHGGNYMTRYAHLNDFSPTVKVGQKIKRGQIIGYMGNTGRSRGTHLHFEVCKLKSKQIRCDKSNVLNPLNFMSNNPNTQFNRTCSDLAKVGAQQEDSNTSAASAPQRSSKTSR